MRRLGASIAVAKTTCAWFLKPYTRLAVASDLPHPEESKRHGFKNQKQVIFAAFCLHFVAEQRRWRRGIRTPDLRIVNESRYKGKSIIKQLRCGRLLNYFVRQPAPVAAAPARPIAGATAVPSMPSRRRQCGYERGLPTGIKHSGCSFTASVNTPFTPASSKAPTTTVPRSSATACKWTF